MRTTVRIDQELMDALKERSRNERVSLTRLLNEVLRAGIDASAGKRKPRRKHREETHDMGPARFPLDKALAMAAALEDEEILRKLTQRK